MRVLIFLLATACFASRLVLAQVPALRAVVSVGLASGSQPVKSLGADFMSGRVVVGLERVIYEEFAIFSEPRDATVTAFRVGLSAPVPRAFSTPRHRFSASVGPAFIRGSDVRRSRAAGDLNGVGLTGAVEAVGLIGIFEIGLRGSTVRSGKFSYFAISLVAGVRLAFRDD